MKTAEDTSILLIALKHIAEWGEVEEDLWDDQGDCAHQALQQFAASQSKSAPSREQIVKALRDVRSLSSSPEGVYNDQATAILKLMGEGEGGVPNIVKDIEKLQRSVIAADPTFEDQIIKDLKTQIDSIAEKLQTTTPIEGEGESKWISVSERQPVASGENVLVTNGKQVWIGDYNPSRRGNGWALVYNGSCPFESNEVTHYQPLPNPPTT